MATWRIWPSTNGDVVAADTTANSLSTEFAVTQAGCSITGYWWWCPASGSTAAKTFSLWSVTTGTTGTRITAANATSGTLTAGAWNFTACTPTALTSGTHYRVIMTFAGGANYYAATANYWATGGGSADIVNGPLKAFTQANATGNIQGGFIAGSTVAFTTGQFNNANYWVDVQVDDGVVPAGSPPQQAPGWFPGSPGMPGGTPFAVAPPPAIGQPAAPPPAPANAQPLLAAPGWFPGAPALPGGTPFTTPGPAPSSPPPPPPFTALSDAIPGRALPGCAGTQHPR